MPKTIMSSSKIKIAMNNIDIGVILPSRGMLFVETLKELLEELQDYTYTIYWSHGNSLPDCFNKPLKKALRGSHSHILIVEDDMVITKGTLKEMLNMDKDVVSVDCPVFETPSGTTLYDFHDRPIFTGTGFMLAKVNVFDNIPKPVFRSDISWDFKSRFDKIVFTARDVKPEEVYGQHDVTFGLYQYVNNQHVSVAKNVFAQRKLKLKGDSANNDGADKIILYNNYKKINFLIIEQDFEEEKVVEVILDGRNTYLAAATAHRLVKEGKAEYGSIRKDDIILEISNSENAKKLFKGVK